MKKIIKYILIIVTVIIALFVAKFLLTFIPEEKGQENQMVENTVIEDEEDMEVQFAEDIIGKLKIAKLNIEAEIKEGTALDTLASYIGHFKNTPLWDGNVALASHNRGSQFVHYFEGIHLLQEGDEIIYITNLGERRYSVYNTKEIESTDWSVTTDTEENILTLITCVANQPEKRLCVQAKEV